jgi:aspartyl-tRNA(Asn)/glutamyl-tRNA(Gln) amidotransferase subunit A
MNADDVAFLSAVELARLLERKELSAVGLVRTYLDRIERFDDRLRAYISVCREGALAEAERADVALRRGERLGPLHGVPFAVKDQFSTAGVRTTQGSRLFAEHTPAEDATAVARLRADGMILLGKLNLTEFALGGTQEFPFGQPRNPWRLDRDPGGSSSGSGIATAAALCGVSLGEDTGGSVRGPAAWCGVVGLRPTWGRVSRHGIFPLSWSMDAAGPLGRTVQDVAVVLRCIAGYDERDPTTSRRDVPDYRAALTGDVRGLRIGVVRELVDGAERDVQSAVTGAVATLERLGVQIEDVSIPLLRLAGAVFMAIADSEGAGLHHPWLTTRPDEYDRGTRRRLLTAALLPATAYHQAQRARALIRRDLVERLERHDLLLAPMSPTVAPPIAAGTAPVTSREEAARRFFTRRSYGSPASLAGLPALAMPCGFDTSGLPIGLQLIGRSFDETTVLRVASAYEGATEWRHRRPDLSAVAKRSDSAS